MKPFEVQLSITHEAANKAVQAVVNKALEIGVKASVAIVDAAGHQVAFLRVSTAPLHSIDIAIDKAYTAASYRIPTSQWADAVAQGSEVLHQGLIVRPRLMTLGGGLPIRIDSEFIGAVGVSGGTEEQDELCALEALCQLGADLPRANKQTQLPFL